MEEITAFRCDKCESIYEVKSQAQICEESHSGNIDIIGLSYPPNQRIPTELQVRIKTDNSVDIITYYK